MIFHDFTQELFRLKMKCFKKYFKRKPPPLLFECPCPCGELRRGKQITVYTGKGTKFICWAKENITCQEAARLAERLYEQFDRELDVAFWPGTHGATIHLDVAFWPVDHGATIHGATILG